MDLILFVRGKLLKKSSETIQLFRLSSTVEKSSSHGNNIVIPKRINRSSTDILKVIIYLFKCFVHKLLNVFTLFKNKQKTTQ